MKRLNLGMLFFLYFFWISPAIAYIDPGSANVIISVMISFFVALGLTIKNYWYKLKSLIFRKNLTIDNDAEKQK